MIGGSDRHESSIRDFAACHCVTEHICATQFLELLLEHQLQPYAGKRRRKCRKEMKRTIDKFLQPHHIRTSCKSYYRRHKHGIHILCMFVYPCRKRSQKVSCKRLGHIGGTHFRRIHAKTLKLRHRDSLHNAFNTFIGESCSDIAGMEIQESVHIEQRYLFPRHLAVGRHRRIFIQSQPCPLEHAKRSNTPMIESFFPFKLYSRFLEERLHLRGKGLHPLKPYLGIRMRCVKT